MMRAELKHRRLSNVRLTSKFHLHYMGLWILLTILLCSVFTYICYRMVEQPADRIYAAGKAELDAYILGRTAFLVWSSVEVVLVSVLIVCLAIMTAHRVAGPYIRICAACEAVRKGNLDYRLKFRGYDRLETVEDAFNTMLDAIKEDRVKRDSGSA